MKMIHRCADGADAELTFYEYGRREPGTIHVVRTRVRPGGRRVTRRLSIPIGEVLAALGKAAKGGNQ